MRIAWFTPFSNRSAIATFSQIVAAELLKHTTVDIWHSDADSDRKTDANTVYFSRAADLSSERLDAYDVLVYNFGNYLPYHREIFHISQQRPGICIMHDFVMHHFFASYYMEDLKNPAAYEALMKRTYGSRGETIAEQTLRQQRKPVWETDDVASFPLFEPVVEGAYGVVTHSRFFRERVEQVFSAPVRNLNLAYELPPQPSLLTRSDLGIAETDVLVTTMGHMNRNKRVHDVVEALGKLQTTHRNVQYAVVGPITDEYRNELLAAAARHGLSGRLRFTGYVDDRVWTSYVTHADFCINLRFPNYEGASGSVLDEMLHAKAVVVYDSGFFAELPEDSVVKAPEGADAGQLATVLDSLLSDAGLRAAIGATACEYVSKEFSARKYAEDFLRFAWEARKAKPIVQLADTIGAEFARIGVTEDMAIVNLVATTAGEILTSDDALDATASEPGGTND